jgi:hypothetical protein
VTAAFLLFIIDGFGFAGVSLGEAGKGRKEGCEEGRIETVIEEWSGGSDIDSVGAVEVDSDAAVATGCWKEINETVLVVISWAMEGVGSVKESSRRKRKDGLKPLLPEQGRLLNSAIATVKKYLVESEFKEVK